jgi:hypothetical protein
MGRAVCKANISFGGQDQQDSRDLPDAVPELPVQGAPGRPSGLGSRPPRYLIRSLALGSCHRKPNDVRQRLSRCRTGRERRNNSGLVHTEDSVDTVHIRLPNLISGLISGRYWC